MRKASCFEVKILVHVYECQKCDVLFAVSQSFEEHHLLQCPVCKTDKALCEVSSGELRIQAKAQQFVVPEGQTDIFEFLE
jgi:predicted nucleic acid-binding Zn ribbon protein